MFIFGIFIILAWLFITFYYGGDMFPRNVMIGMMITGLFSMGWGLLTGKK